MTTRTRKSRPGRANSQRRRRGRGGPPRCNTCSAIITFFGSPFSSSTRPFNPRPVDPHVIQGAYPVMGRKAYRFADLVETVQLLRECSLAEAEGEVYDMPWHQLHACPREDDDDA